MKKITLNVVLLIVCAIFCVTSYAQNGAPHTVSATANFKQVVLKWSEPTSEIALQWHDGSDYNGMDGVQYDPEGTRTFYAGSKFTASDLKNVAGQTVDSIAWFRYRNPYKLEVQIYEDGKMVYSQAADLTGYVKNTWKKEGLTTPYVIPTGKDVMFALKYVYGTNQELMAITDRAAQRGKGDWYSVDGKTWKTGAVGDFLITAVLKNNATAAADGYNVYRDGAKVNSELLTATTLTLEDETPGEHTYTVAAVYGTKEEKSYEVKATSVDPLKVYQSVATITGETDALDGLIEWQAPLKTSNEMTWCNKTLGLNIGGTSTTAPKVWIKQEFEASDMLAYPSHKITAINTYLTEAVITGVTLFVIKNGVIDYSEVVPAEQVSAIKAGEWTKFTLATPYKFEAGNKYSFGCYFTHAASAHPIGVDNGDAVNVKGNSFSISSPTSSGFAKSKPSWKTLASGNIKGNFMLTADVEAEGTYTPSEVAGYDVYRDGQKIASDVKDEGYIDEVEDLGTYTYSVVAKSADGRSSAPMSIDLSYVLPAEYDAPLITNATYDEDKKQVDIQWSADAQELRHYTTPSYVAGFDEDMTLLYGAKFTAAELESCAGYKINTLKFAIGAQLETFNLEIYTSKGDKIYTQALNGKDLTVGALYSLTLDTPVAIPANEDLYLVYNASLPAGTNAMILDAGPAVENGAVISLTDGAKWLNLGTIATDFKNYNLVIGAVAVPGDAAGAMKKEVTLQKTFAKDGRMEKVTFNSALVKEAAEEGYGVAPSVEVKKSPAKKAAKPKPVSFRVYCNNEVAQETDKASYSEQLNDYGEFIYYVTSVFANGWESPASKVISITNMIPQKPVAPYNLANTATDGALNLEWKAAAESPVMTFETGDTDLALGMTGTGTRTSYCAIRYTEEKLAEEGLVGQCVSHINFKLASTDLGTASVFLMKGNNIIFEQPIDVEDLVIGWNSVRLNKSIPVEGDDNFSVGYHITYANGVKPMYCDAGPAVSGYGDLISASASAEYWYSLATKFKMDYNWRLNATFAKASEKKSTRAKADEVVTYNVYCDGVSVATGVTDTKYTVANAATGSYTVTSVKGGEESAESNAVEYVAQSGVEYVAKTATAYFDRASKCIVAAEAVSADIYSANGTLIKHVDAASVIDMSDMGAGIYVVRLSDSQVVKVGL